MLRRACTDLRITLKMSKENKHIDELALLSAKIILCKILQLIEIKFR